MWKRLLDAAVVVALVLVIMVVFMLLASAEIADMAESLPLE